jgi:hypothetical protein
MDKTNKELFIEILEALDNQSKHDNDCRVAFGKILPEASGVWYNNDFVVVTLIRTLNHLVEYRDVDEFIEYFIYHLDFGRRYKQHSVLDSNKKPINIRTSAKLYDYLMSPKCD